MRKILILLTVLMMAVMPAACAAAEDIRETNAETGYTLVFHDEAGLVDAAEQERSWRLCGRSWSMPTSVS